MKHLSTLDQPKKSLSLEERSRYLKEKLRYDPREVDQLIEEKKAQQNKDSDQT